MRKIQEALIRIRSSQEPRPVAEVAPAAAEQARNATASPPGNLAHGSLQVVSVNEPLVVRMDALRDAGLIVPSVDAQLLAPQLREIKRPLLAHAFGKRATKVSDGNLLLISSALAGEGKTFISFNLALSVTHERDHSVVLIDADVAKPHLTQAFAAFDKKGLLDYLEDPNLTLGSVLLPTSIPGLSFIPAGKPRMNSTELLSGSRMDELIERLNSRANNGEVAIFDGPPLLQTTESKVLATYVGQIVLVVLADKTSQSAVINAVSVLDNRKPVNLVLNQVGPQALQSRYAYGYGYNESPNPIGGEAPGGDLV
ncbi:MAG: hypothetical protein ACREQ1_15835 [Woeseiaceae bacterium]